MSSLTDIITSNLYPPAVTFSASLSSGENKEFIDQPCPSYVSLGTGIQRSAFCVACKEKGNREKARKCPLYRSCRTWRRGEITKSGNRSGCKPRKQILQGMAGTNPIYNPGSSKSFACVNFEAKSGNLLDIALIVAAPREHFMIEWGNKRLEPQTVIGEWDLSTTNPD